MNEQVGQIPETPAGDAGGAFERFFDEHDDWLRGRFARFSPDRRDRRCAEVWFRLTRRWLNLGGPGDPRSDAVLTREYLATIARQVAIAPEERELLLIPEELEDAQPDPGDSAVDLLAEADRRSELRHTLQQLRGVVTPDQWAPLVLTTVYERSQREASSILLTSENAIASRIKRARERLIGQLPSLGHYGDDRELLRAVVYREDGGRIDAPIAPRPLPVLGEDGKVALRMAALPDVDPRRFATILHVTRQNGEIVASLPTVAHLSASTPAVWELQATPAFRRRDEPKPGDEIASCFLFESDWLLLA
ncbi:MAG: sigma-70 family RNA polymerase sigma factor [Planctomycetes bacterium]|nr:sigma-70 family RNA polymerase sigma factor [Planctomycetota bacterium]